MKTLLIGISSPIGQSFLKASSNRGLDVIAISDPYSDQGSIYTQLGKTIECDLSDEQKLQELLFQEWPDVLINCTEEILDEEKMASSNTHLPKFLSQLTHHLGTRFIHISSNAIFDGTKSDFYRSTDVPNPQTFYGQTKLLGEKEILKNSSSNPLILRIPEILSSDSKSVQKSFNQKIMQSAQSKQVIELTNTKQFQPTSSTNIADVILELCERNDLHGIFHWAGSETINEYELAKLILNRANVVNPGDLIKLNSDSTISNFCMELHPLKNKLKTQALNLKEIFEELDYREPLNFN
jgi:dTDP-4-dehydrorhamnose reductase